MKDELPEERRVWDAPLRTFHWLLVASFVAAWLSRDARRIDVHAAAGYSMAALLAFRLAWGFAGTVTARFRSFAASPGAAIRYLRQAFSGTAPAYVGHNPAGGWSIFALIALGSVVTISGVLLLSARHGFGPLGDLLPRAEAARLRFAHDWGAWAMLALVGLHLAGVYFGMKTHGENLVGAMISGRKRRVPPSAAFIPLHGTLALGVAGVVVAGTTAYLRATGWMEGYETLRREASASGIHAAAPAWREECGSCHLAYPPELLPDASWRRMLGEARQHFGEDLGLAPETARALAAIAREGGLHPSWAGLAICASVAPGGAPQRITETAFWRTRHAGIDDARFTAAPVSGRHNCEACHADAASAIFSPRMIHIPE